MQLYSYYISWASNAFWEFPCRPLLAKVLLLTHREVGCNFPCFTSHSQSHEDGFARFSQLSAHSAPWRHIRSSTHAKGSWSGLRAQRSSAEQSKAGWWVEPWTPISVAPCCLLNNQPVLPNAHRCLAAFCKPAICKRLQGPCTSLQSCLLSLCLFKISYEAR